MACEFPDCQMPKEDHDDHEYDPPEPENESRP